MNEKIKILAEKYHAGQFRDGPEKLPYIVHPAAVVKTLLAWGEPEDSPAVAAAWGHDLLEDTAVTEREIRDAAGDRVLAMIETLTCRDESRKAEYLRSVAACGDREILLVKLADRICNSHDHLKGGRVAHAFNYLHRADGVFSAVVAISSGDIVAQNGVAAWRALDAELRKQRKGR